MRFLSLLVAALILLAGVPRLCAETADDFLKAYFLVQDGDAADKGSDSAKAIEKYSAALKILRDIKKASPDWNPNIIAYRVKYCSERIAKAGGRVEPEEGGPALSAAPTLAQNPETAAPPVNTVPRDAKPASPEEAAAPPRPSDRVAELERDLDRARQEITKLQREKGDLEGRLRKVEDDLRSAGASSEERMQKLIRENDALKQRLADAEVRLKGVGSNAEEIAAVRGELAKAQESLDKLRGENEQIKAANVALKSDLEDVRGQLRTATAGPATSIAPEVLQTLQKENALLRAIVDRQYQEDSHRMQARDTLAKELDELGSRTESIRQQIKVLATPLSPLSDEERGFLKTPAAMPREDPTKLSGTITSTKKSSSTDSASKLSSDNSILASDAKRLFAKGDLDGAAAKYEAILKTEPGSVFALSNLGVIRFRQERVEEAEKALQGALAADPQDAFSLSVLGIVHYRQGRYDDAVSVLTRAVSINPSNHETHNYLGITYSQKGYQEAAEKELLKAIEIKPDYADAHFNLAVVYASQNPPSIELARKHYRRAVELGMQKDSELEKLLAK